MLSKKNRSLVFIFIFTFGLGLGFLLGFTQSDSSRLKKRDESGLQAPKFTLAQAHEMMSQISHVFEAASASVNASVVSIYAEGMPAAEMPSEKRNRSMNDFGERIPTAHSLGSGVIVGEDGFILTNSHVVAQARSLSVVVEKKAYPAKIVGTDPPSDLAVIKIQGHGLPAARLGDSDEVNVGQWVIAIGNPFHLMHTVTAGIISAKGRSSIGLAEYEDFLQTDASINPGNSGGALVDLHGRVIGINTAIASPSGGNIGLGFAIPINMAKQIMDQIISKGKVSRGYVGLASEDVDEDLARSLNLRTADGALVVQVDPQGPAAHAGLKRGDVILEWNGHNVESSPQFQNLIAQSLPGVSAKIKFLREGRKMEVEATLIERPKEERRPTSESFSKRQPKS